MYLSLIVVCFAVASLLVRRYLHYAKSVGKNPFSIESLRAPEPLVVDKKIRKSVLKRKYSPEEVPGDLDAVVVGSGIGGLSAAALLAKTGKKVLVLEQHGRAGGCCHTFNQKGVEFDIGIHYIGEMGANTVVKNLSDQISNNQLQWGPLDHHYDSMIALDTKPQMEVKYTADRPETIRNLKEQFPEDGKAIDEFFRLIQAQRGSVLYFMGLKFIPHWFARILIKTGLVDWASKFFASSKESVWDVVCRVTENQRLRTAFVYFFMNYGTRPENASWAIHWMLVDHYKHGAFYPIGGASEIPFTVIKVIEESGGKVLMKAPVSQILIDSEGKACGVRVKEQDILAPIVISDAGLLNTFHRLVPDDVASKSRYKEYSHRVESGETAFQIFVGLKGTQEELGIKARNYWIYTNSSDSKGSVDGFMKQSIEDAAHSDKQPVPIIFVSFPSAKDPTWQERYPGMSACVVAGPANYEWFKDWENKKVKKRGDEYDELKNAFGDRILQQFYAAFPDLVDKIEFWDIGTPLSHNYYIAAPKGEIAGLNHSPYRFSAEVAAGLRPKTDIPGLYLTGQDVSVCGFTGAMFGGLLCASSILNRNLMNDLTAVKKQRATLKKKL